MKVYKVHEDHIASLYKAIALDWIGIGQSELGLRYIRMGLKLIGERRTTADYVFSREKVNDIRFGLLGIFQISYALDVANIDSLNSDLLDIEKRCKELDKSKKGKQESLRQYLKDNPAPQEFLDQWGKAIEEMLNR